MASRRKRAREPKSQDMAVPAGPSEDMDEWRKKGQDKKAFYQEYLTPLILYKALELRQFISPMLLNRTLSYIMKHRSPRPPKKAWLVADDLLGIRTSLGRFPPLHQAQKRLALRVEQVTIDSAAGDWSRVKVDLLGPDWRSFRINFLKYQHPQRIADDEWKVLLKVHSVRKGEVASEDYHGTTWLNLKTEDRLHLLNSRKCTLELLDRFKKRVGNAVVSLRWLYELRSEDPESDLLREEAPRNTRIFFRYAYKRNSKHQLEVRRELGCPWCACMFPSISCLEQHLKGFHDHFMFEFRKTKKGTHVVHVSLKESAKQVLPKMCGVQGQFYRTRDGFETVVEEEHEIVPAHEVDFYYSSHKGARRIPEPAASSSNAAGDKTPKDQQAKSKPALRKRRRLHPAYMNRTRAEEEKLVKTLPPGFVDRHAALLDMRFHHGAAMTPMEVAEADGDDSDGSPDREWCLEQSEKLIDEFDDVTTKEKEFLKLWNRWVFYHRVCADHQFPSVCKEFAKSEAGALWKAKLRNNFLLHLITMWEWNLVSTEDIEECMREVDRRRPAGVPLVVPNGRLQPGPGISKLFTEPAAGQKK